MNTFVIVFLAFVCTSLANSCSGGDKCAVGDSSNSLTEAMLKSTQLTKDLVYYNRTCWSPDGKEYTFTDVLGTDSNWFVVFHPANATYIWTTGYSDMPDEVLENLRLGDGQIWNQIADSWAICDKERLHDLLVKVGKTYMQPPTFSLTDKTECAAFFKDAAARKEAIWVTKEPGSSQGDGIIVNPDINVLRKAWLVDPESTPENVKCVSQKKSKRKDTLVQEYILRPLTLEGKKMEIRTYWFVTLDPFYVFYHDGTVRLTTRDYKADEWNDPLIHITNTKQQKKADPNYENTASERKWTLEGLGKYLQEKGKVTDGDKWLATLRNTLKEYIGTIIQAARPYFLTLKDKQGWDGRYELLGMDVILGEDLRVWLTEVQDGPSTSRDPGTVKEKLIPQILTEMADIVLEIDQASRFGLPLSKPLRSVKTWEQIDVEKYKIESSNE